MSGRVAFVLKGYPRLSETFIAQEIHALERRGLEVEIWSLRHPTDRHRHPAHDEIAAPVRYLPEYLYQEPRRALAGWRRARRFSGYPAARAQFMRDWARDRTPNRGRRFGQALTMAAELSDDITHVHAHFLHTPASVARYAAIMRGLPWSFSAHARDIWTSPDWELREKLGGARWGVTCTRLGADHLNRLAPAGAPGVALVYHGLDFARFPPPPTVGAPGPDGSDPARPVTLLSVGRAVAKKGYEDLLDALAGLPSGLNWRFVHIGGGPLRAALTARAAARGVADRCDFRGARPQTDVFAALRAADLFVLASRIADDGDRDGLPNVLMEAQSQAVCVVATNVSSIPELVIDHETGRLTPPGDPPALTHALAALITDPATRARLAAAGFARVRRDFAMDAGVDALAARFGLANDDGAATAIPGNAETGFPSGITTNQNARAVGGIQATGEPL